jgi:uncharacterized protein YcnI
MKGISVNRSVNRHAIKRTLVFLGAAAAVFALAGPAWAHVTVSAPGATKGGGDVEITFRVPVEKDTANTVKLTVALPTDTPIASVEVLPLAGWTHVEKTAKLAKPIVTDDGNITEAVSQITWTAANGGLKPGEYGEFTFIAGQLPDTDRLVFPALQTYSDGSVVSWNQTAAAGSTEEPENPAPILELAASSGGSGSGDSAAPTASASPVAQPASSAKTSTTGPTVLAIIALVVAAAALGLALVGNARRRGRAG